MDIINDHLAGKEWMVGDTYTLVDMGVWGWPRAIPRVMGAEGLAALPNVKRHLDAINARPVAQRAEALKDPFTFKTEMDNDAKKRMFPQNERLKAG